MKLVFYRAVRHQKKKKKRQQCQQDGLEFCEEKESSGGDRYRRGAHCFISGGQERPLVRVCLSRDLKKVRGQGKWGIPGREQQS